MPWRDKPLLRDSGATVKIWVRSVYHDALLKPEPNKEVHYEAVNEFGESQAQQLGYSGSVKTSSEGFAVLPDFTPHRIGSFRIRVDFKDREGASMAYSMPIIIR